MGPPCDMAAAPGVVPAAMEDSPCKKWYGAPPVRIVGKSSRAWRSPGWLPCLALCYAAMPQTRKEKEERNKGAGMPGLVEHGHSRKSPQQCWGLFPPRAWEPGIAVIS